MRHRHSGPKIHYRTRRNRIMYRERPMHKITMKGKEGRRGIRRKEYGEEDRHIGNEIAENQDKYIRVNGEEGPITIGEIERGEAIHISEVTDFWDEKEERLREELNNIKFIQHITPEEKEAEFEEAKNLRQEEKRGNILNELEDTKSRLDNLRNEFDEAILEEISPENEGKKEFLMEEIDKVIFKIKDLEAR